MRVWSYVITTDRGSAPNYDRPSVTLTICKPRIRMRAQKGDFVLAFNGHTLASIPHSVRWAGIISEVLPMEQYWEDPRFRGKRPDRSETPDNIYRMIDGALSQVPNNSHGQGSIATDLHGKNALIFSQAWHMGDDRPVLPEVFNLWVTANRRLERLREISAEEWIKLRGWLDAHNCGIPRNRGGSPCRPSPSPRKHIKC